MTVKNSSHMKIWESVCTTDPKHTKNFKRGGGFSGTAINPTYLVMRATETFGPMGMGWGLDIEDESIMEGASIFDDSGRVIAKEQIHKLRVCLWYVHDGNRYEVRHFGQTMFVSKTRYGPFTDEEAPKKSLTDAMTKCLSMLGFSADVHMGLYDDNKYVTDLRTRIESQNQKIQSPKDSDHSVEIVPISIDEDGNPNWIAFAKELNSRIDACKSVDDVNILIKAHSSAVANMKKGAPALFEQIRIATQSRRDELVEPKPEG